MAQAPRPRTQRWITNLLKHEIPSEVASRGITATIFHILSGGKGDPASTALKTPGAFAKLDETGQSAFLRWMRRKGLWGRWNAKAFMEKLTPQDLEAFLKLTANRKTEFLRRYDPSLPETWEDIKGALTDVAPKVPKTAARIHRLAARYGHTAYQAEKRKPGAPLGPSAWKIIGDFLRDCNPFR